MKKILFTGGGSAGHVLPNIALMQDVRDENVDVCYMGTNGIEKKLIQEYKFPFFEIECPKLIRSFSLSALKNNARIPYKLRRAVKQAKEGLTTIEPDLIFSKGGYVALPVLLASKKLNIPYFLHESDFSLGLTNRLTAKHALRVFTSFSETAKTVKNGIYSGAPIRKSIFSVSKEDAKKNFSIESDKQVLLVFGGGSGSARINEAVRKQLRFLCERFFVLHVCGKGNLVQSNVKNYQQYEFVKNMGGAYACADVILSRSGAGTVFEILALKKPALFVPLAGQTRGDQKENAEYFHKKGLCRILMQENLDLLVSEIEKTADDTELKKRLSESNFSNGNQTILQEIRSVLSYESIQRV